MSTDFENLPDRIDVENSAHLQLWATAFGCRQEHIRTAVNACGPDVAVVRQFIRGAQAARGHMKQHMQTHEMAAAAIARGKSGTRGL
ncbi:DUF3606 domain-containing protein [Variovorax sp. J22G73]|uniref:DUF3606 domain-containing protein n=1 Tax=unclassified Variovorax TaxID=663243 RepID=UPI002577BDFB|nr:MULTISPECIES: DUF3606 domain-containing protein [unclassified Variovorax]MDM0100180.1 DUF3606 domain-containing protein [Variovorax sp. J22G73]